MLVYVSKKIIICSKQHENIEEIPPIDFKVTLYNEDKIFLEERSGIRKNSVDFDCLILRKIKEAIKEAESKGQECVVSIV